MRHALYYLFGLLLVAAFVVAVAALLNGAAWVALALGFPPERAMLAGWVLLAGALVLSYPVYWFGRSAWELLVDACERDA